MFIILDYSSALEYSIIRRYTNIVYYIIIILYIRKKEEAKQEVGMALHVHNEMVMKKICEGGNTSGLYAHMKMLIEKGKETNDSKLILIDDDGEETIDDERIL